jgi:hypothetical protein
MRLFSFAFIVVVLSCKTEPVQPAEVPGVYVLNSNAETDTLQILSGGKYEHTRRNKNGVQLRESGDWVLAFHPDGPAVEFTQFTAVQVFPRSPSRGVWLSLLGRDRSGHVTLDVNSDLGLHFTRIQ